MLRLTARYLLLLLSLFLVGATPAMGADEAKGQRSNEEIGEIIREYLLNNPEVIFQAVERHREKQRQLQARRDQALLKQHQQALLADTDSFVGGNPDGDVTLVEFFDYRCGYCKRFAPTLEKIKKQDPKLRVVYKEFPVLGPDSIRGAQAALAARNQGRYVEFHEALMRVQGNSLDEKTLMRVARSVGLDTERLKKDMENPKIQDILGKTLNLARTLSINGTPAIIVGNQIARGMVPLADLTQMIARARADGS
ncbi:MAG: DsbA family protein [Deltaproteobacteria bacterium]|nr:DsbA family protein [Deltaproteobacteria bacterium]